MSVAAAGGAVSTQLHQPTAEQIRLAQLIDDKKHDRNEVQEIIGKVLDVATNSTTDDVLLALYDCDYDCEKAVALLIEKGHEVASEWRTATNHKTSKKQQKTVGTKNGHGDMNENGQQRGYNGQTSRGGKSRRFQQNGGDSQPNNNNNQQQQQQQPSQQQSNDNYNPQQRQRGGFRGRFRGSNRGGHRTTDRNYQQQTQNEDLNLDNLSMSDTNRRTRGPNVSSGQQQQTQQQQQDQWDVGNWNGETLIYSRTAKEEEQSSLPPPPPLSSSTFEQTPKGLNGQSDAKNQVQSSTASFDPVEAARQIKNVIGIGQTSKPLTIDQQQQQQQKSKVTGQSLNTKLTPPLTQARIPQQPVIFTDHFDGGVNKLDIQFGNLDDSSSVSTSMFYQQQKQADSISSNKLSQRATVPEQTTAHISPSTRPNEQPVMNTQRVLPTQLQQQQQPPSMTMKPVVTPQYTVHQQQPHQINPQNLLLQSLLYHQQTQQSEPVTLDTSYDPSSFPLPSIDFNSPYFMAAAAPPPQQQTQPRYIVSQGPPPPQQTTAGTKNVQTPAGSASTTSIATKKGPAIPPGMFPPTGPPSIPQQSAYSAAYGVQQQAAGTAYSTSYETEHLFANTFIPLNNAQQTQSPTGTYGSVTPPSQPQQANANSENKTLNYGPPSISENMMLLQQYQQFALQQSNSQQQGQQPGTHSPATLSYYLSHPPSGASYSPGHQIMYAQAATAMSQQQAPKQQNQQYNQTNASTGPTGNNDYYNRNPASTNKDGQYMYTPTNQSQSSTGQQQQQQQQQQQGVNKQQRSGGNVYNNQQGHQRPYQ